MKDSSRGVIIYIKNNITSYPEVEAINFSETIWCVIKVSCNEKLLLGIGLQRYTHLTIQYASRYLLHVRYRDMLFRLEIISNCMRIILWSSTMVFTILQSHDQDSLLVKRHNDNHSPGVCLKWFTVICLVYL